MIRTKSDLINYLEQDKRALGITRRHPKVFGDEVWKFQIIYRKYEYHRNVSATCKAQKLTAKLFSYWFHRRSIRMGYTIPINTIAGGLSLAHRGTIVINGHAQVGKNCRIQEGVTIGATNGDSRAPIIGDNVFIGSGAKIIGAIKVANDVAIGAGSVVVKSILEPGVTYAGVPARKISDNSSRANLNPQIWSR